MCETHRLTDPDANSGTKLEPNPAADLDRFIARWAGSGGAERANYGLFLGVVGPGRFRFGDAQNAYVFEKSVPEPHDAGRGAVRRIDYKRGCFVLEAEQGVEQEAEDEARVREALSPKESKKPTKRGHGTRGTKGWDTLMSRCRSRSGGSTAACSRTSRSCP